MLHSVRVLDGKVVGVHKAAAQSRGGDWRASSILTKEVPFGSLSGSLGLVPVSPTVESMGPRKTGRT